MNNYNVVRLINNVTLVGETEFTPENILVVNPLEVYSKPIHDDSGNPVGEQMVLRPFLIMTGEKEVVIDTYNVLFSNRLDDKLIPTYENMAKNVYGSELSYDGSAYVENEVEENKFSKEEAEYLKEVLKGITDIKDDVIH